MGQITGGWMGNGSQTWNASSPMYMHIDMPANEYPKGTLSMGNFGLGGSNCRWTCPNGSSGTAYWYSIYLCDGNGNNRYYLNTIKIMGGQQNSGADTFTVDCPNLRGKSLHMMVDCGSTTPYWYGRATPITVGTATYAFNITVQQPSAGGTISCATTSATPGSSIAISNTPAAGYHFKNYTFSIATTMLDSTHFYMPSGNVTVSAEFEKTVYYITPQANPAGAGIVSVNPGTGNMGAQITISQTAGSGYYFNGWSTSPTVTISNNTFTLPASNVTVTANYLKRSTASLNKSTLEGGDSATLTIVAEKSTYTHKYQLSFGTGMESSVIDVAAGVNSVTVDVPLNWSAEIPNQATKTGGTLTVWTYNGATQIGSYQITGLTYSVPASVVPVMGTITVSRALTIDNVTYAEIDDYYVQNHCGVRIQASASGAQSATITGMTVSIGGYTGGDYNKTVLTGSIDFTSKLLNIAGEKTITISATDSRGRVTTETRQITVQGYNSPAGSISVWRVDVNGDVDDMGTYAKYELSKQYTQLGSNAITWSISCSQGTASSPADTGDMLPGDRKQFSENREYDVTLTIVDLLETFTITAKLPSAKFAMYVQAGGDKIGFMKVPNQAIPAGKNSTFEISGDTQMYYGSEKIEDYIISQNVTRFYFTTSNVTQTVTLESGCGYLVMINRRNTTDDGKQGLYMVQAGSDSCFRTIAASDVATLSISGTSMTIATSDTYVGVSIIKLFWY